MNDPKQTLNVDEFLVNLKKTYDIPVETRDGEQVVLSVAAPSAYDVARAARLIRAVTRGSDPLVEIPNLIRFACMSCIKGIDMDNVVEFLAALPSMPPIPLVVKKCLTLVGVSDDVIDGIETLLDMKQFSSSANIKSSQ